MFTEVYDAYVLLYWWKALNIENKLNMSALQGMY